MVKEESLSIEQFCLDSSAKIPLICGAMFPCSSPGLVRAVSQSGALGIIQPLSFEYVHGVSLTSGIAEITQGGQVPFGINVLLEAATDTYYQRNLKWLKEALESGASLVITALGRPDEVVEIAHSFGVKVYHKATNELHAKRALTGGVDGLIAVSNRAGGHAGTETAEALLESFKHFEVPIVAAGGCGGPDDFVRLLKLGYSAVLLGTRFIASVECSADDSYKEALIAASEEDIVLTERVTGIPLSVINTEAVQALGYRSSRIARALLHNRRTKRLMRLWYAWRSGRTLREAMREGFSSKDIYQAGKSVSGIREILTVGEIVDQFYLAAKKDGLL